MHMEDLHFADDRPIKAASDDLLNRTSFAQALASAITSWKQQDSLVIGLTGSWGSGKSSIKNLSLELISKTQSVDVIEFNPWEWSGQTELNSAFFEEVSRSVGRKDDSKAGKQLAKTLRRYGRRLNAGSSLLASTAKILPTLIGSSVVVGALSVFAEDQTGRVTLLLLSIASLAGGIAPLLSKGAAALRAKAEGADQKAKDDELTLKEIREQLQNLLKDREKPLLIVLDDIDRLSPDQTKAVFQLVKANMDFANVVFLLLYQRTSVEESLRKAGFDGADYLEKIVQVPLSVPTAMGPRLEQILFSRLNAIISSEPQLSKDFDEDYWSGIFTRGMRPFFSNIRNVYRYTSTLAFHCRLMRGSEVAEVNAVDLFGLECLRVFAPATYAALPQHKAMLTGSDLISRRDDTQRRRTIELIDNIVSLAPAQYQSNTRILITEMFPAIEWVSNNSGHGNQNQARWLARSRVCCSVIFDRYFEFSLPPQEIPNSLLHRLASLVVDPVDFCTELGACSEDQQEDILNRLEGFVEDFPMVNPTAVAKTLLAAGEIVKAGNDSIIGWAPPVMVARLLRNYLRRVPEEISRSQILLDSFVQTNGFVVCDQLLGGEDALRRKEGSGDLDDAGLDAIKQAFTKALLASADAAPSVFLAHKKVIGFLFRFNRYAEGAGTRWLKSHMTSVEHFILFAEAALSSGTSYGGNIAKTFLYTPVSTLKELLGIDECSFWLAKVEKQDLEPNQRTAVDELEKALNRNHTGELHEFD